MTERRTADAPAEHGEDTPWRGPASELGEAPGRSRSALLHHALIGALAVSIAVQLFHIALQSSLLRIADVVARAPHTLYDPEDEVTFAFVFGFGAELAIGLVTGALWIAWLAERLPREPRRRRRTILALHAMPIAQLFAPWLGLAALDPSRALVRLRRTWLVAWTLALVALLGPLFGDGWLAPLRATWCAPRGLGHLDGGDWCRWALEAWVHAGGAVAAMIAANVAILLVHRLRDVEP